MEPVFEVLYGGRLVMQQKDGSWKVLEPDVDYTSDRLLDGPMPDSIWKQITDRVAEAEETSRNFRGFYGAVGK